MNGNLNKKRVYSYLFWERTPYGDSSEVNPLCKKANTSTHTLSIILWINP